MLIHEWYVCPRPAAGWEEPPCFPRVADTFEPPPPNLCRPVPCEIETVQWCFCLGDRGDFWDAVGEVSVLMNGDVEKGKIKKKKKRKKTRLSFPLDQVCRIKERTRSLAGSFELNTVKVTLTHTKMSINPNLTEHQLCSYQAEQISGPTL